MLRRFHALIRDQTRDCVQSSFFQRNVSNRDSTGGHLETRPKLTPTFVWLPRRRPSIIAHRLQQRMTVIVVANALQTRNVLKRNEGRDLVSS